MTAPAVFAVSGWKNSGKTTLVSALVAHFSAQGRRVGTIKHAHDGFATEPETTDTARHRSAGARKSVIVSPNRIAEVNESAGEAERGLASLIGRFGGYDLVICEGFKASDLPKIEVVGRDPKRFLFRDDPNVFVIACDDPLADCSLPRFRRDDIAALADAVCRRLGLAP